MLLRRARAIEDKIDQYIENARQQPTSGATAITGEYICKLYHHHSDELYIDAVESLHRS